MFDFDEVIDRRGTHSGKWDSLSERFGIDDPDAIPMWVADMDFRVAPAVTDAWMGLMQNGVHGYFGDYAPAREAVASWLTTRHGWTPETDWLCWAHGLVAGIGFSLQAFTEPGDGVVVFSPVYHMFANTIRAAGRQVVESQLNLIQGRYEMDLEALARDLPDNARMVLFCSPHNPGGRVWTETEIRALAAFCAERDLILVSDEIHHDLVYSGATHVMTARAAPEIADRLVTLVAPTKTFNIAGCLTGVVIIENAALRAKFQAAKAAAGSGASNRFGMVGLEAAYAGGAPWLDALLPYLEANRDRLADGITQLIPGARVMPLEATYLAWVDFSALGLPDDELGKRMEEDAQVITNKGPSFGLGGQGWLRFNFACPRATLDRALDRLGDAFARV